MFSFFKKQPPKPEVPAPTDVAESQRLPSWGARFKAQLERAEQEIATLAAERAQFEQLANERKAANSALRGYTQAQRERTAAAEAKAGELSTRVAELQGELERARTELREERKASEAVRTAVEASAADGDTIKGELAALRVQVQQMQETIARLAADHARTQ